MTDSYVGCDQEQEVEFDVEGDMREWGVCWNPKAFETNRTLNQKLTTVGDDHSPKAHLPPP